MKTKPILFAVAALALAAAGLFVRESNAKAAQQQADQIVGQDTAGKNTTADLASLETYVKSHMGASVSFTLEGAYKRAQDTARAAATATAANSQIYADAQRLCSGKSNSIVQAKCNQEYLSNHLVPVPTVSVVEPKAADFTHQLRAPWWTPDLAGALLLGAVVALGLTLVTLRRKKGQY